MESYFGTTPKEKARKELQDTFEVFAENARVLLVQNRVHGYGIFMHQVKASEQRHIEQQISTVLGQVPLVETVEVNLNPDDKVLLFTATLSD